VALDDFLHFVHPKYKEGVITNSVSKLLLAQKEFGEILPASFAIYENVLLTTRYNAVTDIDLLVVDVTAMQASFYMLKSYLDRHNCRSSKRNESQLKRAYTFVKAKYNFEPELYAVKYDPLENFFRIKRYRIENPKDFDLVFIPCVS